MEIKSKSIAVVDIETTGPNIDQGDRIIQIGAVIFQDGKIIAEHSMLINPERDIPQHIIKLTGITDDQVAKAPTFGQVVPLWFERLNDCVFVAHNLGFDLRFLKESFGHFDFDFNPTAIDTAKIAKVLLPTASGFNLQELSQEFKLTFNHAHDALADAQVTTQLLSKFSQLIEQIPDPVIDEMLPFIEAFTSDESLIFTEPRQFQLEADQMNPADMKTNDPLTHSIQPVQKNLAQLIQEQVDQHTYIIAEDTDFPVSNDLILATIINEYQRGTPLLVSVNSIDQIQAYYETLGESIDQKQIGILKSAQHYLHKQAFQALIETYPFEAGNQQELLVIAGTINWVHQTQTGDLAELNHELKIDDLIHKYQGKIKAKQPNDYFNAALENSQNKQILITDHYELISLYKRHRIPEGKIQTSQLIVTNIRQWIEQARMAMQDNLYLSQWFTDLRYYTDELYTSEPAKQSDLLNQSMSLVSIIASIIDLLETYVVDQIEPTKKHRTISQYYSQQTDSFIEFNHQLKEFQKQIQTVHMAQKHADIQVNPRFIQLISTIKAVLASFSLDTNHFITIKGDIIQEGLYHIKVVSQYLTIPERQLNLLSDFKKGIIFSLGDFSYRHTMEPTKWFHQPEYHYYQLPKISHSNQYQIQVPVDYIPSDSIDEDFQTQSAKQLVEYLQDSSHNDHDHFLIIASNKKQIDAIYNGLIHNKKLSNDYVILAKGKHGSLRKIRRRAIEAKRAIIIIDLNGFFDEQWDFKNQPVSIILQRLPFKSPEQPLIRAIRDSIDYDSDFFAGYMLPNMIQTLKETLARMDETLDISQVLLFDDRVFTKYYSFSIHEALASRIKFEIDE